jgi:Chagasin family peptidase inhibitor I42
LIISLFVGLLLFGHPGSSSLVREAHVSLVEYELSTRRGEEIEIVLESIPGSGAIWLKKSAGSDAISVREERDASQNMGGHTDQKFIFNFAESGRYVIEFELKRPWENVVQRKAIAMFNVR